jgi:hypothetical protein
MILHPHGTLPPAPEPSDHFIVATTGPLRFLARTSAAFLPQLPQLWLEASADNSFAGLGHNPRSRARAFIHNSLVDGYVMHPVIGPAMAGVIAWLLSTVDGLPVQLSDFHLFGYDISVGIAGPPGQKTMFNFRVMLQQEADLSSVLDAARDLPLPDWQPPH